MDRLIAKQKQEQETTEAIMAAQKAEIQRLTEAYQRANIAYEEVTAELRQQRHHVNTLIAETMSIADKKRNEDMKAMRHEMMSAMKEMLQNTQHNQPRSISDTNVHIKRAQQGEEIMDDDNDSYDKRQEKRPNRRKTPTKKLIFNEEHLPKDLMMQTDLHLQKERDDASSISE
jgi:hypothetical protein